MAAAPASAGGGADHLGALARQFERDRLADAARGAGDQGDLFLQMLIL